MYVGSLLPIVVVPEMQKGKWEIGGKKRERRKKEGGAFLSIHLSIGGARSKKGVQEAITCSIVNGLLSFPSPSFKIKENNLSKN